MLILVLLWVLVSIEVIRIAFVLFKEDNSELYKPPYRVGKKQKRVVLDRDGLEFVVFRKGDEEQAKEYCKFLNRKYG